jgi:hypothetical protein
MFSYGDWGRYSFGEPKEPEPRESEVLAFKAASEAARWSSFGLWYESSGE